MNTNHPTQDMLERWLDDDIGEADRVEVDAHLSTCAACRREVESYRALFAELDRIPSPEPPVGFDVRVLDAVLPKKVSEIAAVLRLMSGAYAAMAVMVSVVASAIVLVAGTERTNAAFGFIVDRIVVRAGNVIESFSVGAIDLLKAAGDLLSAMGPAQTLLRGLETAATAALGTQIAYVFALTLTLAALILVRALSSARERGVPHASLSL